MCGIVGIWQKDEKPVSVKLISQMRDSMTSRGPDDAGIWLDKYIGLGHRRLSILDISPLGHQPMVDEETGAVVCYNGEVYNFMAIREELKALGLKFRSQTDTEVVLKAYTVWGEHCVKRFVGMFAFSIWDPKKRGIFLARDQIGIKPLYYYIGEDVILFASRMSALLIHPACPRDIDMEALELYLENGYVPAPWSMIKGVKKLRPGHTLWVDEKDIEENCYWNIDTIPIDPTLERFSENELGDRLDSLLRESVKLQMISDVPLGAFLSGGIDSTTVVAHMIQVTNKPPKTFTIGFKEGQYDESIYARKIAQHLGTEHHELIMTSNDLLGLLESNTAHYDEPFADWSSLPTLLVSKFAREHVTVCLSGDGGDELFAGYHYYDLLRSLKPFYRLPKFFRFILGSMITRMGNHKSLLLGKSLCQSDILSCFSFMRSMIKDYDIKTLLIEKDILSMRDLFIERSKHFPRLDDISKSCRLDVAYYLADDILQKVDVASMSVSLEARVPLLDHRIVEFTQSLPIKYKHRYGQSKWLLKKVLERYVPPNLFERTKGGFGVPIREWFHGELKEMIQDELSPARVRQFGYLKPEGVQRLLDLHFSGKRDTHPMLWVLLSLLRWNERIRCQTVFKQ